MHERTATQLVQTLAPRPLPNGVACFARQSASPSGEWEVVISSPSLQKTWYITKLAEVSDLPVNALT